jgi:hypothetical protein
LGVFSFPLFSKGLRPFHSFPKHPCSPSILPILQSFFQGQPAQRLVTGHRGRDQSANPLAHLGNKLNNRNNHPIRAGIVIGTHNGTIYNTDHLFRRLGLPR